MPAHHLEIASPPYLDLYILGSLAYEDINISNLRMLYGVLRHPILRRDYFPIPYKICRRDLQNFTAQLERNDLSPDPSLIKLQSFYALVCKKRIIVLLLHLEASAFFKIDYTVL